MRPDDRDVAYLWDMHKAAKVILEFTEGLHYNQYEANYMLQSAVERQLEIIGEAARRVSEGFFQQHPEIPWRQIIGMRNILIHEYGEVRADRVWLVVQNDIGKLIDQLDELIPPLDDQE